MGDPRFGEAKVLGRIIIRPYEVPCVCHSPHRHLWYGQGLDLIEQGFDLRSVINACCGMDMRNPSVWRRDKG